MSDMYWITSLSDSFRLKCKNDSVKKYVSNFAAVIVPKLNWNSSKSGEFSGI